MMRIDFWFSFLNLRLRYLFTMCLIYVLVSRREICENRGNTTENIQIEQMEVGETSVGVKVFGSEEKRVK